MGNRSKQNVLKIAEMESGYYWQLHHILCIWLIDKKKDLHFPIICEYQHLLSPIPSVDLPVKY